MNIPIEYFLLSFFPLIMFEHLYYKIGNINFIKKLFHFFTTLNKITS